MRKGETEQDCGPSDCVYSMWGGLDSIPKHQARGMEQIRLEACVCGVSVEV